MMQSQTDIVVDDGGRCRGVFFSKIFRTLSKYDDTLFVYVITVLPFTICMASMGDVFVFDVDNITYFLVTGRNAGTTKMLRDGGS